MEGHGITHLLVLAPKGRQRIAKGVSPGPQADTADIIFAETPYSAQSHERASEIHNSSRESSSPTPQSPAYLLRSAPLRSHRSKAERSTPAQVDPCPSEAVV